MKESDAFAALISTGHALAGAGLSPGTTGNISTRVGDRILVSGTGARLGTLSNDDIAILTLDGERIVGAAPTKEAMLHVRAYAVRPEVTAVVHLHSPAALAVSCLADLHEASPLPCYTPYYAMKAGRVALVDYFPPGDERLAEACGIALRAADSLLLRRHGLVTIGPELASAVAAAEELEANADIHLRLAGRAADPLSPDDVAALPHWRNR